jgi:hypothetical protein
MFTLQLMRAKAAALRSEEEEEEEEERQCSDAWFG